MPKDHVPKIMQRWLSKIWGGSCPPIDWGTVEYILLATFASPFALPESYLAERWWGVVQMADRLTSLATVADEDWFLILRSAWDLGTLDGAPPYENGIGYIVYQTLDKVLTWFTTDAVGRIPLGGSGELPPGDFRQVDIVAAWLANSAAGWKSWIAKE